MDATCKRHRENPVIIYNACVGCELEWYRKHYQEQKAENERLKQECKQQYDWHQAFKEQWTKVMGENVRLREALEGISRLIGQNCMIAPRLARQALATEGSER